VYATKAQRHEVAQSDLSEALRPGVFVAELPNSVVDVQVPIAIGSDATGGDSSNEADTKNH